MPAASESRRHGRARFMVPGGIDVQEECSAPAASRRESSRILAVLLWILVVASTIPIGQGSSAGPHVLALSLLAIWSLASGGGPGRLLWVWLGVFSVLFAHFFAAAWLTPCQDLLGKSVASQLMLVWVILACATLARSIRLVPLSGAIRAIVGFVTVSVVLEKAYLLKSGASDLIRPSGIYLEPSHLALALAPLLVALIMTKRDRVFGWVCTSLIFALSGSATLFVVVFACLATAQVATNPRALTLIPRAVAGLTLIATLIWVSPFRDDFVARVQGVLTLDVDSNMSSVVYVAGWQMAAANLENTNWLGLGVNRMGCVPRPITDAGDILEFFELGDGNYNDGSFTMSKALSEFGALAVAFWLVLAWQLLKAIGRSRRCKGGEQHQLRMLLISALAVMVFGSLVRGTGYFASTFLLGLLATFMLTRDEAWT